MTLKIGDKVFIKGVCKYIDEAGCTEDEISFIDDFTEEELEDFDVEFREAFTKKIIGKVVPNKYDMEDRILVSFPIGGGTAEYAIQPKELELAKINSWRDEV